MGNNPHLAGGVQAARLRHQKHMARMKQLLDAAPDKSASGCESLVSLCSDLICDLRRADEQIACLEDTVKRAEPEVRSSGHCVECAHFLRHREVEKDAYGIAIEVDGIGGDCRCAPPKSHWLTGNAVWPYVLTGHGCSAFKLGNR